MFYKKLTLENLIFKNENGILIIEKWSPVPDYEKRYMVSNFGRVKSLCKKVSGSCPRFMDERIMRQSIVGRPGRQYLKISFYENKTEKRFLVHRLVCGVFNTNFKNLPQVNHKDKNTFNNCSYNLEWASEIENACHCSLSKECSSKYPGIDFLKNIKKWRARIQISKKRINIGSYGSEIEAHKARINFELKHNIQNKYSKVN